MKMDLHHNVIVEPALLAQTLAATANGAIVDTAKFHSLELVVNAGTFAYDGSNNVSIKLEHGDESDLSDAVDVPAEFLLGNNIVLDNAADDEDCWRQGYIGKKRYVRAVFTVVGTVSAPISATFVLGHPKRAKTEEQDATN